MRNELLNSLLVSISESRFSTYQDRNKSADKEIGFTRYVWNMALSESLYPVLQGVEITLRNSIHNAVSRKYNSHDWFDYVLVEPEINSWKRAREEVQSQKGKVNPNDIVSALTFGFWTGLLRRNYEQILWPQLLEDVFPYMPRDIRTRGQIARRVHRIRNLRNRVFHHEPVWHWNDLESHHNNIREVIDWINPDILVLLGLVDRFPETFSQGPEQYRDAFEALGSNLA